MRRPCHVDRVANVCDNCPTIYNPGQNLDACVGECGSDPCTTIITDDFDSGFNPSTSLFWDSAEGASASDHKCGSLSPGKALYFGGRNTREVISGDISRASSLSFSLIIGTGPFPCDDAKDYTYGSTEDCSASVRPFSRHAPKVQSCTLHGKDVFLEFLIGGFWTPFAIFDTEDYPDFSCVEMKIPAGATKFKLSQPRFSGTVHDHWAIDDVKVHSCECCHPLLTAQITDDSGLYYAANGCEGFVACYPDPHEQHTNFGFQECVAPLLWDGANGLDGLTPAAHCNFPAGVNCGGYCVIDGWTPPMPPMGCCSDGVDGTFPINDCSQFVMCTGGVQSDPFDCPDGLLFKQTGPGVGWCDWAAQVDCPLDTCMPMAGLDRRLGAEEADKQLRGGGF